MYETVRQLQKMSSDIGTELEEAYSKWQLEANKTDLQKDSQE